MKLSDPHVQAPASELALPYIDTIVGAAIFDLNGLPKEYFMTDQGNDISWVQTVFQALGLRSLLSASLQLDGFRHAIIHGKTYCALVVKQKARYVALLLPCTATEALSETFISWAQNFEPNGLKMSDRFCSA